MILWLLHILACLSLAGASLYWRMSGRPAEATHKFLFPFIIAAMLTGLLILAQGGSEVVAILYGSSYQIMTSSGQVVDGRMVFLAGFLFLILPGFGLFPPVGKRPWLVATLALLSPCPLILL